MRTGQNITRGLSTLATTLALIVTAVTPAAADAEADTAPDGVTFQVIVREDTAPGEAPEFEVVEADFAQIVELLNDPSVDSVELDGAAQLMWRPDDPDYLDQWEHHVTGIETAWSTTRGSAEIVIAILDSGVNPGPEFGNRLLAGASFTGDNPLVDPLGHGTSVAGVAAAGANNGVGGVGSCPECTLLPVQVADSGGAVPWSAAANGVVWAVDQGADIINLSFGSKTSSAVLQDAIEYALSRDVIVIAAAGNYGSKDAVYPASVDGVISVAAHNASFDKYSWSSSGKWVDAAAPGCAQSITVTGTGTVCGTSFASPWTSGLVALLLDTAGAMTPAAVETVIEASTSPLSWVESGNIDASVLLEGGVADLQLVRNKFSARNVDLSGAYRGDVVRVDLVVDGTVTDSDNNLQGGTFDVKWDASEAQPGTYQLQVDAIDGDGDSTRSQIVMVEVIDGTGFTDVVPNAFYEDAVSWMVIDEITTGTSPTSFSPDDRVTRGQLATFLWRFAGEPTPSAPSAFTDTSPTAFYADGVSWMVAEGITNGTSPTTFSPDDAVTRGQLAAFMYRYAGSPTPSSRASFVDTSPGAYYAEAIDWLVAEGITTGTSPTTFSPDSPVTRGQLATFLWRLGGSPII